MPEKETLIDHIVQAFSELGRDRAHLSEIYAKVKEIRERKGIPIGSYYLLKAYIRWTLQNNSRGRGKNIFHPVKLGTGVWEYLKIKF